MIQELIQSVRLFLHSRQRSYQTSFSGIHGEKVLTDLAKFCRAHQTSFHPDPRVHAVLEGRREVWLRIQHHLKLDSEQLWEIYKRKDLE